MTPNGRYGTCPGVAHLVVGQATGNGGSSRAAALLASADLVLHDGHLSASTRSLIGLGADVEAVDEDWVERLAREARAGRRVVRIVVPSSAAGRPGGDVDRLLDAGVPVEVCGPRSTLVVSEEMLASQDPMTSEATSRYPGLVRIRTLEGAWRVWHGGRATATPAPGTRVVTLPEPARA